ncbi:MAG TPA: hypothetical protein VIU93_13520 [Gallionellaceae bacterium]
MNTHRLYTKLLLAGLLLLPLASRAADVDLYSGLSGSAGVPNVLIVFDNAANFSSAAAAGAGTCNLTNTATGVTAPNSLAGTVGGIEQCALTTVLRGLPVNPDGSARVNIGFMVYNSSGITDHQGQNCGGSNGGCLAYPLTPMSGTSRTDLLNWITTWQTSASGSGSYWIKASGSATAASMQEAWAYYAGQTGMSGRSYASIQPPSGCQKNFVIFIGNSYSSAGSPGDGGSISPAAQLTSAYGSTPIPTPNPILGSLNTSCGAFTFPSGNSHITGGYYADEWSRFMHSTDIFSAASGTQSITTYTIGVLGPSCQASYAATLMSTANNGGGKYFATSDDNSIVQAILAILNEVQAVNSVFAAATLPVSVNAQGTYLNQIYMGMFRPDAQGNPRWVGNLKQYQFQFDLNRNLYLADATGQPAISSGGTGFITPTGASFWTCTNPAHAATLSGPPAPYIPYVSLPPCATDPANGFWANNGDYLTTTTGGAFDLQDGEVVEKGGVSQQIRLANLTVNYATSPAAPRNLYTWCPSDPNNTSGTCVADLTDPSNVFATTNTGITGAMLGTGVNLAVTSITRSGTVATATTAGSHGLVAGTSLTVSGASQPEYNGLVTILTVPASNKFTYTVVEYPPTPATTTTTGGVGGYVATLPSGLGYGLSSLTRIAAGTNPTALVTGVTSSANTFTGGSNVTISGATPANYNLTQAVNVINSTTFTYPITINPTPSPVGSYVVSLANAPLVNISSASCNASTKVVTVSTATAHGLRSGDQVNISNDTQTPSSKQMNGNYTNVTVTSPTQFSYQATGCPGSPVTAKVQGGPAAPLPVALTRNETTVGTASVSAQTGSASQFANGDLVNVTLASGTQPANETGYLVSSAVISCSSNPCGTTFSYSIVTTPGTQPSGSMTAAVPVPGQTLTSLTHSGTTATATVGGAGFADGSTIVIMTASGTTLAAHEAAYLGNWVITCVGGSPCTTFTYGPLTLTPVSPATGSISASNPGLTPDRVSLINWVRGEDNYGDELSLCPPGTAAGTGNCPSPAVTVRPSVHGDTLHSRPITINYGGTTGVVVFYGSNDGVYRAINGNQSASIGPVAPGGELWGFIAPDFYNKLNRQRTNSPALLLPSTPAGIIPTPAPKDYFFDGPTGVYRTTNASGPRAIIYIGSRRGGHFLYAMDVTNPLRPYVLWRISDSTPGFGELGQTWSLPQVANVAGYANPVLFFGAGYDDGAEDAEPPTADNQGRGIFAVDAITGALVWSAAPRFDGNYWNYSWFRTAAHNPSTCTGTTTQATCLVDAMNYSIAADVTLVDRDNNGTVDRLYAVDVGGNVWRVDFEPAAGNTPNFWQVTQLAQLGCPWGAPCNYMYQYGWPNASDPGNPWVNTPPYAVANPGTPRKFLFPVEIINATSTTNYDAIFVGSGDREHPLYGNQSYGVINRMYMIRDYNVGNDSVSQGLTTVENDLVDCTGTSTDPNTCSTATTGAATPLPYCQLTEAQRKKGYYVTLNPGEKVVNAPLAVVGQVFFGTNQPIARSTNSCATNLGVARGYSLNPFCASTRSVVYDGGGMPPSPVSGIVQIGNSQALFCIGCGAAEGSTCNTADCRSSEGGGRLRPVIPAVRSRTYWYLEGK